MKYSIFLAYMSIYVYMKYSRYQKPHIISILDCAKGVSAGDKL